MMTGDRVGSGCGVSKASHQLPVIREVTELADGQVLGLWFEGGRSIDFFPGHIERDHEDIDWSLWASDARGSAGG